jgi:hypothetical protein
MLDLCLVAVRLTDGPLSLALERLERLERFYHRLGQTSLERRVAADGTVVVAAIDLAGQSHTLDRPLSFGAPPPTGLESPDRLLEAGDAELRRLEGPSATAGVTADRARLVTSTGPPSMLYAARSPFASVWSTQAVAAAYLAHGEAQPDPAGVAELVAAEYVGGTRTLIRGATAVEPATCVELDGRQATARSYWPASERWRPVAEDEAHAHTERALLASLDRRVPDGPGVFLALTAGLDSRVAAAALRELGRSPETFTWGDVEWPDVAGAHELAAALGMAHRFQQLERFGDEAIDRARLEARWHEGPIHVGWGRVNFPSAMHACVTGSGGETGRAFYYRHRVDGAADPGAWLADALCSRIPAASADALAAVRASAESWVAGAAALGYEGWRALDLVYAEQRLKRWLRAVLPRERAAVVPAFTGPEVQRGLVSLPLEDRLTDGFHRRFLADRGLVWAPASDLPRTRRRLGQLLRRLAGRALGRREPGFLDAELRARPAFRTWIADEVLSDPMLETALGARWCQVVRDGVLAGEEDALDRALWAAGPVLLSGELRELNSMR